MDLKLPSLEDIKDAHRRISPFIHRTPVLKSSLINKYMGAEIFFKCENFQSVGAFKFRGATNAVMQLSPEESSRGVGTHSSGNHAAALAKAAAVRDIPAYIVMPETSPEVKKKAVAGYGAKIYLCRPTLDARESKMEEVMIETGCTFVHPYNRFDIIAGQGTAALELLEDIHGLDLVMAPVGGGGLISGTSICAKGINPDIKVWAGEPEGADDAYRSLQAGKIIPSVNPQTMADGLLTSLGELTFKAVRENVDEIRLCSEENIVKAMRLVWERMKIIIEPSSAVPLGALIQNPGGWEGKRIGIIISGGNVELSDLPFKPSDI